MVPVINENDTVSVEEIKFGDNDALAAMVVDLVEADLLVILTDVGGLYTPDPRKHPERPPHSRGASGVTAEVEALAGGGVSRRRAPAAWSPSCGRRGAPRRPAFPCAIVQGEPGVSQRLLAGEDVGTLVQPAGRAAPAAQALDARPEGRAASCASTTARAPR